MPNDLTTLVTEEMYFMNRIGSSLSLGEMQRIAFRLMLSSCVCVSVCLSVCVYAAFVDLRKTV